MTRKQDAMAHIVQSAGYRQDFRRRIDDAQRMQDMFAHEVRDAYEITAQQADLLDGFV